MFWVGFRVQGVVRQGFRVSGQNSDFRHFFGGCSANSSSVYPLTIHPCRWTSQWHAVPSYTLGLGLRV